MFDSSYAWLFDWKSIFTAAIGAAIPVVPVYLFGFRQTLQTKDSLIEHLREEVKKLEKERVSAIIEEKNILIKDLAARAEEKAQADKAMENVSVTLQSATQQLKDYERKITESAVRIQDLSSQVREATELVEKRVTREQTLGLLVATRILIEGFAAWRTFLKTITVDAGHIELDRVLAKQFSACVQVINRVRAGNGNLTIEEAQLRAGIFEQLKS